MIESIPRVYADFQNVDEKGRLRLNCNGTTEDLMRLKIELREGLELLLSMEEVEALGRVCFSLEESLWVAEVDWHAITVRD